MVSEGKTSLADLYVCTKAVAKSIKSEHGLSRLTSASGVGQGQRRQKQKGVCGCDRYTDVLPGTMLQVCDCEG